MSGSPEVTRGALVQALGRLGGRATLGDLMGATSLPAGEIEAEILNAIAGVEGSVAVDENGALLYSLERRRAHPPEAWRTAWRVFISILELTYTVGLLVFLLAYFVFYLVLALAIAIAGLALLARGGDCDCDCGGCDCDGCDCKGCDVCDGSACACASGKTAKAAPESDNKAARVKQRKEHREQRRELRTERVSLKRQRRIDRLGSLRKRFGLTAYKEALGVRLEREVITEDPPLARKVFEYIFGPRRAVEDPEAETRNVLAFIRDNNGRLCAADVVALTGATLEQAEARALQLAASYEGDIIVSDEGTLIYVFATLVTTAAERTEVLDWVMEQGRVSVETFAEHFALTAAEARARLSNLSAFVGGREEHEAESVFVFGEAQVGDKVEQLRTNNAELREYTYAWERLEKSPAILGVPNGRSGWIVALNTVNLIASVILMMVLEDADGGTVWIFEEAWGPLFSPTTDLWVLGVMPFFFSAGVFLIPIARTLWRNITDRGRLRRNAHRVFLLALFNVLDESDHVEAKTVHRTLYGERPLGPLKELRKHLAWAARAFDGSIDEEAGLTDKGYTYVFERLHAEVKCSEREREAVNLEGLQVGALVYDSNKSD